MVKFMNKNSLKKEEKGVKKKDLGHVDVARIKQYIDDNQNGNKLLAEKAVVDFLTNYEEWKEIVGYMIEGEDGGRLYGAALSAFSGNLCYLPILSKDKVKLLRSEIIDYEKMVVYMYGYKSQLYLNLVLCLYKRGRASKKKLKKLLKNAIYYSLAESNHASYQLDCYAFRSVSDYLFGAFRREKLCMSSPTTFNDPFDCPILEILNRYGDEISQLVRKAYQECVKITCFVKNTKILLEENEEGYYSLVRKHDNDPDEYLNELMWAHYAQNHTGICVKYHFENGFTKFADASKNKIAYFRDITYTSDIYSYGEKDTISMQDAFFVKGKSWEYENELRLLAYDINGSGKYASIEAKNSIAAVYFGLKCPEKKRNKIMNILKGKKWKNEQRWYNKETRSMENKIEELPIEFFQMEIDKEHFGKLKAVKIL